MDFKISGGTIGGNSRAIGNVIAWVGLLFFCVSVAFFPKFSYAAEQSPKVIDVGIYLNSIPSISLKEKKFQADFYIWFRWVGNNIDPMESFEIVNGHIDSKEAVVKKKIGNINYASARVAASLFRNFDVSRYPLDKQTLKIQIEDNKLTSEEMAYRPDKANTAISPKIDIAGWHIEKSDSYESVTTYATNYGDISLQNGGKSKYPRYTFSLDLKRGGYAIFIKLFATLFLAGGLSFCAFAVRSDHIDARFALILSGVFLAGMTQSSLASILPESDLFCMADQLCDLTLAIIVLVFVAGIYTFGIYHNGDEQKADRVSRLTGRALAVFYVVANILIVAFA